MASLSCFKTAKINDTDQILAGQTWKISWLQPRHEWDLENLPAVPWLFQPLPWPWHLLLSWDVASPWLSLVCFRQRDPEISAPTKYGKNMNLLWMGQRNPAPPKGWLQPYNGINHELAQDFATIHSISRNRGKTKSLGSSLVNGHDEDPELSGLLAWRFLKKMDT